MTSVRSCDAADNLTQLLNGTTQLFDPANQLISSTTGNQDANSGNQKGGQQASSSQTKTTTYSYDLNGNRIGTATGGTSTTLGFDQANRLINFNSISSYGYNGDGLRMSKTTNNQKQQFTWALSPGLPLTLSDANNQYIYGPGGLPIERISSKGQIDFFHHDQLGSTRLLTDKIGHVEATFTFDPYGNLSSNNSNGQGDANSNSNSNHGSNNQATTPLLFAGQYLDSESGLYYMRARYYDPTSAQFLSRDPALPITRAAYGYVAGNPLNARDPGGAMTAQEAGINLSLGTDPGAVFAAGTCPNPADRLTFIPCSDASFFKGFCGLGQDNLLHFEASYYYSIYFQAYSALWFGTYIAPFNPFVGAWTTWLPTNQRSFLVAAEWYGMQGDVYIDNVEYQVDRLQFTQGPLDEDWACNSHGYQVWCPGFHPWPSNQVDYLKQ